MSRRHPLALGWLLLVYAFLYLPIAVLIVYSFNDSRLLSVWGGFTLKWYGALAHDREVLEGFAFSLEVAAAAATLSVLFGCLAALALHGNARFAGRRLFVAMLNTPLVVPEVITGLSLLLFFVALQRHFGGPARGFATIVAGHVSVGMAYAAVMVHARLKDLDRSLEEAALDLGCRPLGVFFLVTLPLITQALGAAWLLTFTLSLDDVGTSAVLSGPGATTLPIVILSRARLGLNPTINAISTVTVAAVAIALCASTLLMRRHEQRRAVQVAGTG